MTIYNFAAVNLVGENKTEILIELSSNNGFDVSVLDFWIRYLQIRNMKKWLVLDPKHKTLFQFVSYCRPCYGKQVAGSIPARVTFSCFEFVNI